MADEVERPRPSLWRRIRCAVWVFCKAQISALFASTVDFLTTIVLAKFCGVFYVYATFTGSVVGGVVNCFVNYGWAFHGNHVKIMHMALKYLMVWAGSLVLNTWGTYLLTEWLTGMTWVNGLLGRYVSDVFILSKLVVACVVAFFWNYQLYRLFVYRNRDIRGLLFGRRRHSEVQSDSRLP